MSTKPMGAGKTSRDVELFFLRRLALSGCRHGVSPCLDRNGFGFLCIGACENNRPAVQDERPTNKQNVLTSTRVGSKALTHVFDVLSFGCPLMGGGKGVAGAG